MSTTLDEERRQYQEMDRGDTKLHIEKWITLIQNDDPLIYSQWDNYTPCVIKDGDDPTLDDYMVLMGLIRNMDQGRKHRELIREMNRGTRELVVVRRDTMNLMVDMFQVLNEHMPNKRITRDMNSLFTRLDLTGNNPFDILYYFNCIHKPRERRDSPSLLMVSMITLIVVLLVYWVMNR